MSRAARNEAGGLASVCQGCGTPVEQPIYPQHGGRRRKWCSDRCRKRTAYGGRCEICGAATYGGAGPDAAPKRCRKHNAGNERNHERAEVRWNAIEVLWRAGLTIQEIADHTGDTHSAVSLMLHRMRVDGRDIPYGYDRRPQSVAKRAREAVGS